MLAEAAAAIEIPADADHQAKTAAEKKKKAADDLAKYALSEPGIRRMTILARGVSGIPIEHECFDADPWLVGVRNGTLDLRTGTLRPADRLDLITKQCPVDWVPDASAPRFDRAMTEWFPDEEVRAYVLRVAGSALVGAQRDHVLIIHYGAGRNGKGTFIRALQVVLGPYARVIHLSLLVDQKREEHDTVKARLFRARLAVASETEKRVSLKESSVKNLTGGDRITARRMREDPWEFDPSHALWFQTNHLPEISGRDRGIWSRIRVVKWVARFEGKAAEKGLDDVLAAEAPGILRRLVEGCLAWQQEGLREPEAVVRETLAYRNAEDKLSRFQTAVGLEFDRDLWVEAGEIQELLAAWAAEQGIPAPRDELAGWLKEQGASPDRKWIRGTGERKQARIWRGVGVREGGLEPEEGGGDTGDAPPGSALTRAHVRAQENKPEPASPLSPLPEPEHWEEG